MSKAVIIAKTLQRIIETLPTEYAEQRTLLHTLQLELEFLDNEIEERQRAPPWLTTIWEMIQWLTIAIILNGYIYRSVRRGTQQHKDAVGNSFRITQLMEDYFRQNKKLVIFFGSKHFSPNKNPDRKN